MFSPLSNALFRRAGVGSGAQVTGKHNMVALGLYGMGANRNSMELIEIRSSGCW